MKELKDIVLKKGDIVFYSIENDIYSTAIDIVEIQKDILDNHNIIKIQRPTQYETIYEAPKQILDKEEKEWLENFLRPFRDRVNYIKIQKKQQIIAFMIINVDIFCNDYESESFFLPEYRLGTMYKNMEIDKRYTLDELGLFEGE